MELLVLFLPLPQVPVTLACSVRLCLIQIRVLHMFEKVSLVCCISLCRHRSAHHAGMYVSDDQQDYNVISDWIAGFTAAGTMVIVAE